MALQPNPQHGGAPVSTCVQDPNDLQPWGTRAQVGPAPPNGCGALPRGGRADALGVSGACGVCRGVKGVPCTYLRREAIRAYISCASGMHDRSRRIMDDFVVNAVPGVRAVLGMPACPVAPITISSCAVGPHVMPARRVEKGILVGSGCGCTCGCEGCPCGCGGCGRALV